MVKHVATEHFKLNVKSNPLYRQLQKRAKQEHEEFVQKISDIRSGKKGTQSRQSFDRQALVDQSAAKAASSISQNIPVSSCRYYYHVAYIYIYIYI